LSVCVRPYDYSVLCCFVLCVACCVVPRYGVYASRGVCGTSRCLRSDKRQVALRVSVLMRTHTHTHTRTYVFLFPIVLLDPHSLIPNTQRGITLRRIGYNVARFLFLIVNVKAMHHAQAYVSPLPLPLPLPLSVPLLLLLLFLLLLLLALAVSFQIVRKLTPWGGMLVLLPSPCFISTDCPSMTICVY
jgi:hypothetical protein